ncbi:MAG: TIGR04255 family protein [Steroidobacteraceae bacterium]
MSELVRLNHPPIIEAVVDIDCDLPPDIQWERLESQVRDSYRDTYPKFRKRFSQLHEIRTAEDATIAETSMKQTLEAFQLIKDDGNQLVQVRRQGFSFNKLAPYPGLDTLLPEIRRTWEVFCSITSPRMIRRLQLRYINRIHIPFQDGGVDLNEYLRCGPRLPDEDGMALLGFLNQYSAVEKASGLQMQTVLTAQSAEGDRLSLILDNAAFDDKPLETCDWPAISTRIAALRALKNRVFQNTLQPKCLDLFQ